MSARACRGAFVTFASSSGRDPGQLAGLERQLARRRNDLTLDAYRAAAAHGADPTVVAFEEGLCQAQAERWELND